MEPGKQKHGGGQQSVGDAHTLKPPTTEISIANYVILIMQGLFIIQLDGNSTGILWNDFSNLQSVTIDAHLLSPISGLFLFPPFVWLDVTGSILCFYHISDCYKSFITATILKLAVDIPHVVYSFNEHVSCLLSQIVGPICFI